MKCNALGDMTIDDRLFLNPNASQKLKLLDWLDKMPIFIAFLALNQEVLYIRFE